MKSFKLTFLLIFFLLVNNFTFSQNVNKDAVADVLDDYFEAIGGKERARQVKTFYAISQGILNEKKIVFTTKLMLPNFSYTTMNYNSYLVSKNVFNGSKGYVIQQDLEEELDSEEIKRLKKNRSIFPEFDYYNTATYMGIENVNNTTANVLKIEKTKVYYDTKTGLKIKGTSIKTKQDHTFVQQLYFSKHVDIEGLKFPAKLLIVAGNQKIDLQIKTIYLNRDVTKKDFE